MKMSMSEAGRLGYEKSKQTHIANKQKRIDEYYKNPFQCFCCNKVIPYEKRSCKLRDKKRNQNSKIFCSRSCAAQINNGKYPKKTKIIKKCVPCNRNNVRTRKTTNNTCLSCEQKDVIKKWINGEAQLSIHKAKKFFIEKYGYKCSALDCAWDMSKKPTMVELDHIDGNWQNNSFSNLRLLCCNCHSQTETFRAKNTGNGRAYRRDFYKKHGYC